MRFTLESTAAPEQVDERHALRIEQLERKPHALGDAELQEIVLTHNLTPRKCLGFLTPLQALLKELGKDVQIRFA